MAKYIRTLTVYTNLEIQQKEVPLFRGAVLNVLGDKANLLFHNHVGDTQYRYSYPLIQYKRLGGKAAIVCVEDGVDLIGQYLTETNGILRIGEREAVCDMSSIHYDKIPVQICETPYSYRICQWLPLNSKNYQVYKNIEGLVERISMLENILKGNLLSMLKGLDVYLEQELTVKITQLSEPYILYNKGIGMTAFNADFCCNLTIPNHVGVGKNASVGYGIITRIVN